MSALVGAHPRLRGEHAATAATIQSQAGSSPLTRGAPIGRSDDPPVVGFIPAYAGSTTSPYSMPPASTAHPRLRGEHRPLSSSSLSARGSSPLTRRARGLTDGETTASGLTPAYAGSTSRARPASSGRRAHPRLRGEHTMLDILTTINHGSSPLTRGAQPLHGWLAAAHGLIPAYAGSTQVPRKGWQ